MISDFWEGTYNEEADELPQPREVTLDVPVFATFDVTVYGHQYMLNQTVDNVVNELRSKIEKLDNQANVEVQFSVDREMAKDRIHEQLTE